MNINLEAIQELSMSWGNVSTKNKLNKFVDDTAFKYVQDLKMPKAFDKYQGYSHVRFNKYSENKKMLYMQTIFTPCLMKERVYQY